MDASRRRRAVRVEIVDDGRFGYYEPDVEIIDGSLDYFGDAFVDMDDALDAINTLFDRDREAFEWALAREAMSPLAGPCRRLMERLRRVVDERPKLCAALAITGVAGLGYWLWHASAAPAEDAVPENARCPICMDRAVSAYKGEAFEPTFVAELCCVCGAVYCAECADGVMKHALGEGRVPTCALCRARLLSTGAARHLRLRHLVEKRPQGPHVAQALYELGSMRARGDGCVADASKAVGYISDAAKRGHARAALALAACLAEGKGCVPDLAASRSWLQRAARGGSSDAKEAVAFASSKGGGALCAVACYEAWTKRDEIVSEAVGPSSGLEDVAHGALSLAARIRDGLGLVANDARNGSRLAADIVDDLSAAGGDLRAARDAFRDYLDEAEATHGDAAWDGTSDERRAAILQVFRQVDGIIAQIQPQAPDTADAPPPRPARSVSVSARNNEQRRLNDRAAAGLVAAQDGGLHDATWTVRWASGATEPITTRDGRFSVCGEHYVIRFIGETGTYFFQWPDGSIQTLEAFDGHTITWSSTHPEYPRVYWDRRPPSLDEVPTQLADDWVPPRTVRMGASGLEEVPLEEESLPMRGVHAVAQMLRNRQTSDFPGPGLAMRAQSTLRAAENLIRAPTELRFGAPPPPRPRADDADAVAREAMARRFDWVRRGMPVDPGPLMGPSETEREERWAEANRPTDAQAEANRLSDELERQADEDNRRAMEAVSLAQFVARQREQDDTAEYYHRLRAEAGDAAAENVARMIAAHAARNHLNSNAFRPAGPPAGDATSSDSESLSSEASDAREFNLGLLTSYAGDMVTTSTGRLATVLERRPNGVLYVELDGNANREGAAFERKTIRASEATAHDEVSTVASEEEQLEP